MPPKVSVNICCYNSEKFIKETLQSILDQTFNDFEVIVIDDGSKDKTRQIIKSFSDSRIKYFYQDNQGLSISRNKAIELSKGKYIALIDHDDCWIPDKLELQVQLLEKNAKIGLVYSDSYIVDEKLNIKNRFFIDFLPYRGNIIKPLLHLNIIPCLTAVFRRELVDMIGDFDPALAITEDYDFFIRIAFVADIDYIDKPLARCRIHSDNTTGKNLEKLYKETISILRAYDNKTKDSTIKKVITEQLMKNYRMLVLFYLKFNRLPCINKEVMTLINKEKNIFIRWGLFLLSFLPLMMRRNVFNILFMVKKP